MSIWTNKKLIDTILSAKIIKNKSSIYYSLIEKEMPESENIENLNTIEKL